MGEREGPGLDLLSCRLCLSARASFRASPIDGGGMSRLGCRAVRRLASAAIALALGTGAVVAAERAPLRSAEKTFKPLDSTETEHGASWTYDGDAFAATLTLAGALNRALLGWD